MEVLGGGMNAEIHAPFSCLPSFTNQEFDACKGLYPIRSYPKPPVNNP